MGGFANAVVIDANALSEIHGGDAPSQFYYLFSGVEGGSALGVDLLSLPAGRLRKMRRQFQMIFQDPYGSLNPRMRVVSKGVGSMPCRRPCAMARRETTSRRRPTLRRCLLVR